MKQSILYLLLLFSILTIKGQTIDKPNVIIFYTDDLGWQDTELNQDIEFDNNEVYATIVDIFANGTKSLAETPNLLRLAALGVNFSQAYSPAPTCAPSRTAMMSGHHTTQTEMTHVGGGQIPEPNSSNSVNQMIPPFYPGRLALSETSIAEALATNGYTSGHSGKWHMAVKNNAYPEAINQGFDFQFTERGVQSGMTDRHDQQYFGGFDTDYPLDADGRPYDTVTEQALSFMEANKTDPFFLYMATWLVHAPIQTRDLVWLNYYRNKLGMTGDFEDDGTITAEGQNNPYFASMIATVDWSVGKVLDYLEATDDPRHAGKKLIETTYIIFSSDNGAVENVGAEKVTDNYPLDEGKKHIQEGGVRTPLLIAGPDIAAGNHFTNVVSHLDFFPTILEWTGADATVAQSIQDKLDGVSLAPFLEGTDTHINKTGTTDERTDLYWHFPNGPDDTMQSSLRSGMYKLYHNHLDDSYEVYQLYNVDGSNNDIEEMNDISTTMNSSDKTTLITKLQTLLASYPIRYPQWNANYTGTLTNKENVPSIASTIFNEVAETVTVTMVEDPSKANITGGYLIYTSDSLAQEEWFQGDETLTIVNGVITADVPEDATSVVLNLIDDNNFAILTDEIPTAPVPIDGNYTNADDTGDGTWDTATNWTGSILPNTIGIATLERTIDLGGVDREVGQILISGNNNTKTFSNGTLILNGTTSTNNDQIIRNRSNQTITITSNVTVNVDDKVLHIRDNANTQLIFNTGTFALGSNTINVDNQSTATTTIPVEFNGAVTGDSSSSINIINQDVSLGASSDFSGFTGSITFGGTNGLLTVNGLNTIEGSIGVLAASDGNSIVNFKTSQSGLANLSVNTQPLAIDFDAAATAVEFAGYTTSTTEGVVDLQNYISGVLRIGTNVNGISQTILDTWLIDGIEPADGTLVQDADGYIHSTTTNGTYTNAVDAGDGTWATATNWTNSTIANANGIATLQRTIDLETNSFAVGQVLISGNNNPKTFSNGTIILNGTTSGTATDQIIRNRSNKTITIDCNVIVNVDDKELHIRNNASTQLIFNTGTFALGSNTINVDNQSTATTTIPVEFNGIVTGDSSSRINIINQDVSLGALSDFSGFTGSITFGGTNGLLTVNGVNTIEGSIGVLAASDGNSIIEFNANQSGLANLTVDTQALAIDFDAAATAVEFTGYTESTTEGVVDLQNYVSGTLRIGTSATSVPSAVLDTWTIDGVAANLVQDASGYIITTNTWNGSTNSDWTVGDNWSLTTAPSTTENVIIPTGLTNYPTIATVVTVNSISLADDASLVFSGIGTLTATTSVTYQRTIDANKWYLMSSPVVGESYDDDWVIANGIASGQNNNRGVSNYDNTSLDGTTGHWRYFQAGTGATTFNAGQGYGIRRSSAGTVSFTGTGIYSATQTTTIAQSTNNFSLVSNPFTAYLNAGDFFADNAIANLLENPNIWVWNANNGSYDVKLSGINGDFEIAHGQAFFVESGSLGGADNLTFDIDDVSHQGTDNFQKNTNTNSLINISVSDEKSITRNSKVYFIDGTTTGFDPGFDGELFGGVSQSFALFSELIDDNGKNYQIQSLPTSLKQSAIIPLGLIVAADKEIKIIAEIENLPIDVYVYLEDREKGTFTLLNDNGSFNFTTAQALTGKGRFYLHTSAKALSTVNETLKNVSIYKLDNSILKIKGLSQGEANIKLFDTFGKQLMNNSFDSNGSQQQINLPKLAIGIYIVQLKTDVGTLNKKMFLE